MKSADEFETSVMDHLDKLEDGMKKNTEAAQAGFSKQEKLLGDFDRLDKDTKKVVEEITLLKRVANDQQANMNKFVRKFEEFDLRMRCEMRGAYGDSVGRIQRDPELRNLLNAQVRKACLKEGQRLGERWQKILDEAEAQHKALGEDTSPGSTLIDDRLAMEIYNTLDTYGVWSTFRVVPLTTKQTKFPVKTARAVCNFILTEGGTISDDATIAGTSVTAEAEVAAVLLNVAEQFIEDSEFDVTAFVLEDFAEAYALRLDYACIRADGTADATNGGMTGITQGGTVFSAAAGEDTVEELDLEDFMETILVTDATVRARQSKWWMHPSILVRTLGIKDSNGRPIFLTAMEAPSPGAIGSILGYPVIPAMAAVSTNTANSRVATFGDPGGLVVGIRRGFTFEASREFRWANLQRSFRGWGRFGVKVRVATAFGVLRLTT